MHPRPKLRAAFLSVGLLTIALPALNALASTPAVPEGTLIAFESNRASGDDIWLVDPAAPSNLRPLTTDPAREFFPTWSPDNSQIVFTRWSEGGRGRQGLWVIDVDDGEERQVLDVQNLENLYATFWASHEGGDKIYYVKDTGGGTCSFYWIYAEGAPDQLENPVIGAETWCQPDISAGQRKIANTEGGRLGLYLAHLSENGEQVSNIGFFAVTGILVNWSPSEDMLAFAGDPGVIFTIQPDGTSVSQLDIFPAGSYGPNWSPDGKWIAAYASGDLYIAPTGGEGPLIRLTDDGFRDSLPRWSRPTRAPALAQTFYLHGTGQTANPSTLFMDLTAPSSTNARYRDSASVNFKNGNPWRDVGVWNTDPSLAPGDLVPPAELTVWVGLKNSDDQGTNFDIRVELYNDTTLVASGQVVCVTNLTRNPSLAREVRVPLESFPVSAFDGTSNVLATRVLTRIGTTQTGDICGGHASGTGMRLYFDSASRPSRLDTTFAP
jgi:Tol biopolymer transport system component